MTTIRTRYATHPGSNVGDIRATARSQRATVRIDQSLPMETNHRAAAVKLADKLTGHRIGARPLSDLFPAYVTPGEVSVPLERSDVLDGNGYAWTMLEPWPADKARELAATARRLFRDHGHAGYWDDVTRENCGACALNGYGDDVEPGAPIGPNYAGWARDYVQAGRAIPARYADAFRVELAGAPYDGGAPNVLYANALRRDILTYAGQL